MAYNDNYNNQGYNNQQNGNYNNRQNNNFNNRNDNRGKKNNRNNNFNNNNNNNFSRNNQPRNNNNTPNRRTDNANVGFDFREYIKEGFPIWDMDDNKIDISGNFSGEFASKAVQMSLIAIDNAKIIHVLKQDPKKYTEVYETFKAWALEIINNNVDGTVYSMDYVNQHMNDLEGLFGLSVYIGQKIDLSFDLSTALRGIKDRDIRDKIESDNQNNDNNR